jgi:hypothetical protein
MNLELEVLDPRHEPEPDCWAALRARAGLRADWSWTVLTAQAWCSRAPWLVTILRDAGEPVGVVCACWAGLPMRRHAYVSAGRARWAGVLHVRSPGTSALPGWWAADGLSTRDLLRRYISGMRREFGPGMRGALIRSLGEADLPALAGRVRLVRPTEELGQITTAGWREPEDWLATLSKNRRKDLRKICRRIDADPTIEVIVGPGTDADPFAVAALLRHNERKYRHPLSPLPQHTGYLAELFRQPDVVVIRYHARPSGELLGVGSILDHPRRPVGRHWSALPVEQGGRSRLYFHCYTAMVSWAVRTGRPYLLVGKTLPEVKRSMGAELVPQFAAAVPVWW